MLHLKSTNRNNPESQRYRLQLSTSSNNKDAVQIVGHVSTIAMACFDYYDSRPASGCRLFSFCFPPSQRQERISRTKTNIRESEQNVLSFFPTRNMDVAKQRPYKGQRRRSRPKTRLAWPRKWSTVSQRPSMVASPGNVGSDVSWWIWGEVAELQQEIKDLELFLQMRWFGAETTTAIHCWLTCRSIALSGNQASQWKLENLKMISR